MWWFIVSKGTLGQRSSAGFVYLHGIPQVWAAKACRINVNNKTLAHTPRLGGDPIQRHRPPRSSPAAIGSLATDDWGEGNRRNERFERETILVVLFVRTHHEHMLSSKERHH
jgi:hypothetical protein